MYVHAYGSHMASASAQVRHVSEAAHTHGHLQLQARPAVNVSTSLINPLLPTGFGVKPKSLACICHTQ